MDIELAGVRVRANQVSAACCAVEAADGLALLADAASPWSGDGPADVNVLIVAGTVTGALLPEVMAIWQAVPTPRVAVAFGACTISGGPYWDSYSVVPGLAEHLPGMIAVAGCPPRADALVNAVEVAVRQALPAIEASR